jgi:aspartate racemase
MTYINNTQNKKTIGILGGMGPLASANLYHKIIKIAQEEHHAEQDTDFPPMIIYNLPLFGFDETGFANPTLVKGQLIAGVKKLESAGSDFIIIACNTVHHFYQDMQDAIKIPIISIIKEAAKVADEKGLKVVGLLSSESTNKLKIYQKVLDDYAIKTLSVTDQQQKLLNEIILHVMSGTQGKAEKTCLQTIIDDLCKQGAQGVILGCTELPLAICQDDVSVALLDSTEIIAKSALQYTLN